MKICPKALALAITGALSISSVGCAGTLTGTGTRPVEGASIALRWTQPVDLATTSPRGARGPTLHDVESLKGRVDRVWQDSAWVRITDIESADRQTLEIGIGSVARVAWSEEGVRVSGLSRHPGYGNLLALTIPALLLLWISAAN